MKKRAIILYGPTAVGKSDLVIHLSKKYPIEVINADVGQLYTPLSIGTAKPDWKYELAPHHLFDLYDSPIHCTSAHYRSIALDTMQHVCKRGRIPIIVGGTGFYLRSLFFPPQAPYNQQQVYDNVQTDSLWKRLEHVDKKRAHTLNKNDRYRIIRALSIWDATGRIPSSYMPQYQSIGDVLVACVQRDKDELYKRINHRVKKMMHNGWMEETFSLRGTPWESFLKKKKLIGYNDILAYQEGRSMTHDKLIDTIATRTRRYAKRQNSFWRMLSRQLDDSFKKEKKYTSSTTIIALTNSGIDRYSKQVLKSFIESGS